MNEEIKKSEVHYLLATAEYAVKGPYEGEREVGGNEEKLRDYYRAYVFSECGALKMTRLPYQEHADERESKERHTDPPIVQLVQPGRSRCRYDPRETKKPKDLGERP